MLSYLGTAPVARAPIEVVTAVAHAPAKVLAAAPVAAAPVAVDPMQLVLSIVSERTGYPIETLGPDLDLEADLSIDSIKRIEIVGELAARLGLQVGDSGNRDALVEELATRKTLRSMVTWLESKMGAGDAGPAPAPERAPVATATPPALRRFVPTTVAAPLPINGYHSLAGKRFTIHADVLGIAPRLAALLAADGAVTRIADGDAPCDAEVLVHLGGIDVPSDPIAATRTLFEQVREAVIGGVGAVLVATGRGGHGGAAGLVKTVAAEWPSVKARVVRLDLEEDPDELAARLRAELLADDATVEIAYPGGVRSTIKVVPAERAGGGTELALGRDSVVLLTGGARGITARVAVAMARRFGCTIELVGRSPLPARDEDPAYAAADDEAALRRLVAARDGVREPAAIAAAAARLLADREIRATLAAIRDAGAAVTYHEADVRGAAFAALIDDIYARHGRIDGVVHGAGVLEDKLIRHKTAASFERVYATKVAGALTLAEKLRADVGFVVLFGSISGAFGNRGQVDYAAANDALDKIAWMLDRRIAGRVVALDWGPWAGTGMVSPELEREYARRGIHLIDPDVGVEGLLAELEHGAPGDAQVILMSGELHG
jgi:NAD(P)-dependent dehydrogenase (short-subunit alcohol dehydrogenase family)